MKKLLLALALIIALQGCSHTRELFKCKCECETATLECSSNQKIIELEN